MTKKWAEKVLSGRVVSAETFRREFGLEDILDYIKTGIGAVIEDEVTQRFVAEDLKVRTAFCHRLKQLLQGLRTCYHGRRGIY